MMGLWFDEGRVVGAALFDMYFGEAFVGALEEYKHLYNEILKYAYDNLKDDSGLGVAIHDGDEHAVQIALKQGFVKQDNQETIMSLSLNKNLLVNLPSDISFTEIDPMKDAYELQWLFWQGFDHGADKKQFEQEEEITPQKRKHFNPHLTVAAINEKQEMVGLAGAWYDPRTEYAYLEPVCVIPAYRKKGIAKAMIYEVANRCGSLGAKKLYVLTDFVFYERLGFVIEERYTFFAKG